MRSAGFNTPGDYKYEHAWYAVPSQTSVVFRLEACKEAHIALSKYLAITSIDTYEVAIGAYDNKISAIRSSVGGEDEKTASTPDILGCTVPLWYWISWVDGGITLGTGSIVGESVVLSWEDAQVEWVEAVGLTTAMNQRGIWEFTTLPGEITNVHNTRFQTLIKCNNTALQSQKPVADAVFWLCKAE